MNTESSALCFFPTIQKHIVAENAGNGKLAAISFVLLSPRYFLSALLLAEQTFPLIFMTIPYKSLGFTADFVQEIEQYTCRDFLVNHSQIVYHNHSSTKSVQQSLLFCQEENNMAHVISDECVNCGACASACPVSCISEGDGKYVVDGPSCIDCGACEGVCPTGAIKAE